VTRSSNLIENCAAWNKSAERELGVFLAAVTELFGAGRARHAADDLLDELELQETFPVDLNWRPITVAAAIRLAQRLNGAADVNTRVSPLPSSNCSGPRARAELFDKNYEHRTTSWLPASARVCLCRALLFGACRTNRLSPSLAFAARESAQPIPRYYGILHDA
jgi:hypothetical protein